MRVDNRIKFTLFSWIILSYVYNFTVIDEITYFLVLLSLLFGYFMGNEFRDYKINI